MPLFSTIAFPNIFRLADGPGWSVNNHQGFCSYQSESHRFWIAPIRGQRGTIFQVNTSNKGKKVAAIEEDQWPDITGGRKVRTIPLRGYTLREKFGYTPGRGSCAIHKPRP
jgi:hypothetical protein